MCEFSGTFQSGLTPVPPHMHAARVPVGVGMADSHSMRKRNHCGVVVKTFLFGVPWFLTTTCLIKEGRGRLAPEPLGGAGETSSRTTLPKEGDNSSSPELNHVQSTGLWPQGQNRSVNKSTCKHSEDTACSLAAPVHMETASSSDLDSLDTEERSP